MSAVRYRISSWLRGLSLLAGLNAVIAAAASPASIQTNDQDMVSASGLLNIGKPGEAIRLLEALRARDPGNVAATRLLARAYLRSEQADAAIAVLQQILTKQPDAPQELYGLGLAHAMKHEADAAFEWFGKAKATRKFDMTTLQSDKHLDFLHPDPRFAALLPVASDFANPFVENVKIIAEWDGEHANDQFGWIARSLGDIDGDGIPDFVTSAPTSAAGGEQSGRVYVYSTRSHKLLWSTDGKTGDQLGSGVESAGDTDGDGVQDVIASAPGAAAAYVYSGKDGRVLLTVRGENKDDNFGNHVASAGDIDHDGHADFISGAPNNGAGGKDAGRAYVYSGKDAHVLLTLTGADPGDQFGSAVTGYSDGRRTLLVIGAPGAGPQHTGRVYIYDGLTQKPKFTFDADASGNKLGYMFLAVLGDVDGDGTPDIYASDWSNAAKGPATGRIYVLSGKTGKLLFARTGQTAGEGFGTTHAFAGDIDHDGRADLVVGSWQYAGAAISGGRAYLYSGKTGALLKTYTDRIPGDTFGFDAIALGDVDGDGSSDLLITAAWSGVHGFHSGRVFVISSGIEAASH